MMQSVQRSSLSRVTVLGVAPAAIATFSIACSRAYEVRPQPTLLVPRVICDVKSLASFSSISASTSIALMPMPNALP